MNVKIPVKILGMTKCGLSYSVIILPLFPSLNWPRMFTAFKWNYIFKIRT